MPSSVRQDLGEGSKGAGRDDIRRQWFQILDSGVVEGHVGFCDPGGFYEKGIFSRI